MASTGRITTPSPMVNNNAPFSLESTLLRKCSFGQVSLPPPQPPRSDLLSVNRLTNTKPIPTATASASASASAAAAGDSTRPPHCLSQVWRELQGANNWDALVEPLHPLLRAEIVRYGELAAACYAAFDLDPASKRYHSCKYSKKNMFRGIGMENPGYEVTKYIYATPDVAIPSSSSGSSCGRWIGYVAESSDDESRRIGRRDVLVTFRGTVTGPEWIANFMSSLTPARLDPHNPRPDVKVESGFLSLYTSDEGGNFGLESCREQLLSEISRLINKYEMLGEEMSVTVAGHSMGSSLGLLLAYDIAELGLNRRNAAEIPVTVFSFAGPRVGNLGFKERCEELGVKVLRVVNVNDPVTKMPGVVFNENFRKAFAGGNGKFKLPWIRSSCYVHVGVELALDFFKMHNPYCVHDIETYISLLKNCTSFGLLKHREEYSSDENGSDSNSSVDLVGRARGLFLNAHQNLSTSSWATAASNMVHLVQSQMT